VRRETVAESAVGLKPHDRPTWWANRNPGLRYVRCELPARQLGGHVDFTGDAAAEGRLGLFTGPQIFQLPCTRDQLELIGAYQARGQPVLAEFDDDYTRWDADQARGRGWSHYERDAPDRWSPSVEMARVCAAAAAGVIVSTPYLARAYRELNQNVHVCRNSVEPADWPPLKREPGAPFRVVLAAAPDKTDAAMVRRAMEWTASRPDAEAVVVGQDPGWRGVKALPWVHDLATLRRLLVALAPDVGLRPLQQTRFARGKSDLKVLEYAMCGALSVVGSGEPYRDWYGVAWFAQTPEEFLQRVQAAYRDRGMVRGLAAMARQLVLTERTIRLEVQVWAAAIRSSSASHSLSR
jgi:hypothetical protein